MEKFGMVYKKQMQLGSYTLKMLFNLDIYWWRLDCKNAEVCGK